MTSAKEIVEGDSPTERSPEVLVRLRDVLAAIDPDGPSFEAEIGDALVFAEEAFELIGQVDAGVPVGSIYSRVAELSEAHDEMAGECEGLAAAADSLAASEVVAARRDLATEASDEELLGQSALFASRYSAVISAFYVGEDF